jgi:hypothetical protein
MAKTAVDQFTEYTPIELLPVVAITKQDDMPLRQMFVRGEEFSDKEFIEYDEEELDNGVATYVSRKGGPHIIGDQGFDTVRHATPYLYEEKNYTPSDFVDRAFGETIYEGTMASRMQRKVAKGFMSLNMRFDKAEELQISEALETGKVTVAGDGVDFVVDFGRKSELTVLNTVAGDKWSDVSSDIIGQLEDLADDGRTYGYDYNTVLLDPLAAKNFLKNTGILANKDKLRVHDGSIKISNSQSGKLTYLGNVEGVGLSAEVYSYNGKYRDQGGTYHSVVSANTCIFYQSGANWKMHYGMIENFKTGNFVGKRFPMSDVAKRGKSMFISLESSPLIGMYEPNSVSVIKTEGA